MHDFWLGMVWLFVEAWSGLRSKLELLFFLLIPGSDTASSSSPPPLLSLPLPIKVYFKGFQNILCIQPQWYYQWYFPHFHLNILSHCFYVCIVNNSFWPSVPLPEIECHTTFICFFVIRYHISNTACRLYRKMYRNIW